MNVSLYTGSVTKALYVDDAPERRRCLNAVALQNACCVLNATLSVTVRTTGLPKDRASLIAPDAHLLVYRCSPAAL